MDQRSGRRAPGAVTLDRPPNSTAEWARSPATTKRAQVRGILEQLINSELHSGDAIPSERALVSRLGVSRVTVRQAIADLVDSGVLERVHGKGTYITGPQVDSWQMASTDRTPCSRMLPRLMGRISRPSWS